eukprot:scaffold6767_cov223-Isochrysis_galbana.AAC.11
MASSGATCSTHRSSNATSDASPDARSAPWLYGGPGGSARNTSGVERWRASAQSGSGAARSAARAPASRSAISESVRHNHASRGSRSRKCSSGSGCVAWGARSGATAGGVTVAAPRHRADRSAPLSSVSSAGRGWSGGRRSTMASAGCSHAGSYAASRAHSLSQMPTSRTRSTSSPTVPMEPSAAAAHKRSTKPAIAGSPASLRIAAYARNLSAAPGGEKCEPSTLEMAHHSEGQPSGFLGARSVRAAADDLWLAGSSAVLQSRGPSGRLGVCACMS